MKLVWHIVRKDAWQQRYLIGGIFLTAMLLAFLAVKFSTPGAVPIEAIRQFGATAGLALLGIAVLSALFVAALVHAEGLAGANEHWLARPIAGGTLFAAKLIALLLFVVLPLLLFQAAVLIAAGFALSDHWRGLLSRTAVMTFTWILPVFGLATVTRNWQQLAAGLVCAATLSMGALAIAGGFAMEAPEQFNAAVQNAMFLIAGTVSLAVAAGQYRTRRVQLGRLGAAVGLLVLVGGPPQFAPSLYSASRAAAGAGGEIPNIRITFDQIGPRPSINDRRLGARSPNYVVRDSAGRVRHVPKSDMSGQEVVSVPLRVDGVPSGYSMWFSAPNEARISVGNQTRSVRLRVTGASGSSEEPALVFDLDREVLRIDGPMQIHAHLYITYNSPPRRFAMPVLNGSLRTLEIGHCQSWVTDRLHVVCQRPYEFRSNIRGFLTRGGPSPLNLQVFSEAPAPWPLIFDPLPLPLAQAWGGLSIRSLDQGEEYRNDSIVFEVSEVLSRFEQDVVIDVPASARR